MTDHPRKLQPYYCTKRNQPKLTFSVGLVQRNELFVFFFWTDGLVFFRLNYQVEGDPSVYRVIYSLPISQGKNPFSR
jgi:hypothetical protein